MAYSYGYATATNGDVYTWSGWEGSTDGLENNGYATFQYILPNRQENIEKQRLNDWPLTTGFWMNIPSPSLCPSFISIEDFLERFGRHAVADHDIFTLKMIEDIIGKDI